MALREDLKEEDTRLGENQTEHLCKSWPAEIGHLIENAQQRANRAKLKETQMNDATAVEDWEIAACIEEEIAIRGEFHAALDKQEARIARKLAYIDQANFEEEM